MKAFYKAKHSQAPANQMVTMMEFLNAGMDLGRGSSARHLKIWSQFGSAAQSILNKGFNGSTLLKIKASFERISGVKTKGSILSIDNAFSTEALISHMKENKLALVTADDFFYIEAGQLKSLNGTKINTKGFLLAQ